MKSKIALHAHNFGHKNIGDEAMAQNVFNKLNQCGYEVHTITTYEPPLGQNQNNDRVSLSGIVNNYNNLLVKIFLVAVNRLKLKLLYSIYVKSILSMVLVLARLYKARITFPRFVFPKLYKLFDSFNDADIYLRSGSGSLNDIWFWSSLMPQYTEARLAKLFNVKVYFTGQGIGPITGGFRENIMRKFVENIDFLTLRDKKESEKFLDGLGCSSLGQYESVGDDAHDLPSQAFDTFPLEGKKYIVCQFRSTDYENNISDRCWTEIASQVDTVTEKYPDITFCFISFSNGIVNDLEVAKNISKRCKTDVYINVNVLSPEQAKWVIKNAVLAIGQSYHFGVFAVSANVPFIGLYTNEYYKLKHTGLLEWYSLDDFVVNLNEDINLLSKVEAYIEGLDSTRAKMEQDNEAIQENINKLFNGL